MRVLDPPAERATVGALGAHAAPFAGDAPRGSARVAERGHRGEGREAGEERGAAGDVLAPLPDLDGTFELLPLAVRCRPPAPAPPPPPTVP
jgi:hypothetical protein